MPTRLLLAADILRDVARTVNAADRPLLEAAADELADRAAALCAAEDMPLDIDAEVAAMRPSIRRLAAAFDPEAKRGLALLVH